jgi:hypothetical protein
MAKKKLRAKATTAVAEAVAPPPFTLAHLRNTMLEDYLDHRAGDITQAAAQTRATFAASIIETLKIEGDAAGAGHHRGEVQV